jgi:hypothetical protein
MQFVDSHSRSLLRIADFVIALENKTALPAALDDGIQPFLIDNSSGLDFTVELHQLTREHELFEGQPVYRAAQKNETLWEIYECLTHRKLIIYNPNALFEVQQVVELLAMDKRCKVYAKWDQTNKFTPLEYPLLPLILYHLTTQSNALMIHASAVNFGGKGFLFSGFSGVGKSTLAKLFHDGGAMVVNDDRVIIRIQNNHVKVYNTPMYYMDQPKESPVHGILFPLHAPQNSHQQLSGAAALAQLMAFVIHHAYDKQHLMHHMNVAAAVAAALPLNRVGVVPNPDIIDYICNIHGV